MKIFKIFFFLSGFIFLLSSCNYSNNDNRIYYTVSFNPDGGSFVQAQSIEEGKFAIEPKSPTKENYSFIAWYNNSLIFDFSTPITSDITLTAKWNPNKTSKSDSETAESESTSTTIETKQEEFLLELIAIIEDGLLKFNSVSNDRNTDKSVDSIKTKFYLSYIDMIDSNSSEILYTGANSELVELEFFESETSSSIGTATISFKNRSRFNFTLYCVDNESKISTISDVKNNAYLVGYATADLRYTYTVRFYMTSESL